MFFKPTPFIDYKPPKLTQGQSGWFISYYVMNPASGKLKRMRIKINHIQPIKERKRAAKEIIAAISQRLALGWNPLVSSSHPQATETIFSALDSFLNIKKREAEKQSIDCYKSYIKIYKDWLQRVGLNDKSSCCLLTKDVALAFMDHLDRTSTISARTYNNYLSFMGNLHGWMVKKGYLMDNPYKDIQPKPRRLTKKKRKMIDDDVLCRLFAWLDKNNPEFLAVCLICYCCFVRPKEIALLKCADIDIERQLLHIRAEIAKNDNESYRTIPDTMVPALRRLDLSNPDFYVFGKNTGRSGVFVPGPQPVNQKKFADYWATTIRKKIGFGTEYQLYSLKDTGITNMAASSVPINLVQQQADHSNIAVTSIYIQKKKDAELELKGADIIPR